MNLQFLTKPWKLIPKKKSTFTVDVRADDRKRTFSLNQNKKQMLGRIIRTLLQINQIHWVKKTLLWCDHNFSLIYPKKCLLPVWLWLLKANLHNILFYPRFENYDNFWLVKTLGIKNSYSWVLLGHITGCN